MNNMMDNMMENTMDNNTVTDDFELLLISIKIDEEKMMEVEEEMNKKSICLKNEEFGIGVVITEDNDVGVYGDDDMRRAAISFYWDENAEQIEQAFIEAKDVEEQIKTANAVILGTIIEIMEASMN